MLKADYIVEQWFYKNRSCICLNNTANHLKFGQQLFGLTLSVNRWLWNPAMIWYWCMW